MADTVSENYAIVNNIYAKYLSKCAVVVPQRLAKSVKVAKKALTP